MADETDTNDVSKMTTTMDTKYGGWVFGKFGARNENEHRTGVSLEVWPSVS